VGGVPVQPCDEAGSTKLLDADGNGELNITDAIHVLAFLFQGGPAHALGESCVPIAGCPDACAN
jgi:hypothetical protein